MNKLAVGVEGDIGAPADIPLSVSIAAEAISLLLVLSVDSFADIWYGLTSHCSSPCENNLFVFIYFQQMWGVQLVNISAMKKNMIK